MGEGHGFRQVGIGWQIGAQSGWGTYGVNLALELARRGIEPALFMVASRLYVTQPQAELLRGPNAKMKEWSMAAARGDIEVQFPVIHALGDKLYFPNRLKGLKGHPNAGAVFFETAAIPQKHIDAARIVDVIITGSGWNAKVLKERGLSNVRYCPQGVDLTLFRPGQRAGKVKGRFAVFSGGKLEYRKGQYIAVAAFKIFHARHPDALLVTAWNSPWPETALTIAASPHAKNAPGVNYDNHLEITAWLQENGIAPDAALDLGFLANASMPSLLREMDLAVFPNRCEGGTNLVAMECMASGVPVVLSRNTGHLNLIKDDNCYSLDVQQPCDGNRSNGDLIGWGESSVEEVVEKNGASLCR